MTITIHQDIHDYASLSRQAQLVLGLIPGGTRWLQDMSNEDSPSYTYNSEADFLSAVLDGLHNTNLLYIPAIELFADPELFLQLGEKNLEHLCRDLETDNLVNAVDLCFRNHLYNNPTLLSSIKSFLSKSKIPGNALFQQSSLLDQIHLYELANEKALARHNSKSLYEEAAEFAVARAQSVDEFIGLFRLYLVSVDKLQLAQESVDVRELRVDSIYGNLSGPANDMLICPQISGSTSMEEVNSVILTWIEFGNNFGYSSLPAAVLQMAKNIPLNQLYEDTMRREIMAYNNRIHAFLRRNPVTHMSLTQDGNYQLYRAHDKDFQAIFSLDKFGCLVLVDFSQLRVLKN